MNWIKNLWNGSKDLKKQIEEMKVALDECGSKLVEKQEHINTTNAYWKKKMYETKLKKDNKKQLQLYNPLIM